MIIQKQFQPFTLQIDAVKTKNRETNSFMLESVKPCEI